MSTDSESTSRWSSMETPLKRNKFFDRGLDLCSFLCIHQWMFGKRAAPVCSLEGLSRQNTGCKLRQVTGVFCLCKTIERLKSLSAQHMCMAHGIVLADALNHFRCYNHTCYMMLIDWISKKNMLSLDYTCIVHTCAKELPFAEHSLS